MKKFTFFFNTFLCILVFIVHSAITLRAQDEAILTFLGHSYNVETVDFSPDGKYLVSGGGYFYEQTSELYLWKTENGQLIRTFVGHKDYVKSAKISPNGKLIISGSSDKTVKLWQLRTGKTLRTFSHHTAIVNDVAFSSDSRYFVSASSDQTLKLCEASHRKISRTSKGHTGAVNAVVFSPDGKSYASGSFDFSVKLWRSSNGQIIKTFKGHSGTVFSVDISHNNKLLVSGSGDRSIKIWDIETGKELKTLKAHTNWVSSVKFSPDSRYIISGSYDNTIRIWETETGLLKRTLKGHTDKVNDIAISPDGRYIASASGDKTVKIWSTTDFSSFENIIKNHVYNQLDNWQKRGRYEKIASFQQRVNDQTRAQMIDSLTQAAIDSFATIEFKKARKTSTFVYDTESEVFKISFASVPPIYLPVPIDEAKNFDENFQSIEFFDTRFNLYKHQFVITHTKVRNQANNKVYAYDINNPVTFHSVEIAADFKPIEIDIPGLDQANNTTEKKQNVVIGRPDVDLKIPRTNRKRSNAYALIIGNEDYSSYQNGLTAEVNVDYAMNDAKIFHDYMVQTIGVPQRQTKLLINATAGQMKQGLAWIKRLAEVEKGHAELFFYYSGHGLPHETTKEAYLIPVDVAGTNVEYGIKLKEVYKTLTENPAKKVTVFIDACFSGGARNQGLVAMKSVKIKPKDETLSGNIVVFASSSEAESSAVFREKQHGYFTYYVLKKMQETQGDTNYKELADYVIQNVLKETALISKKQTPQVNTSNSVKNTWMNWKLSE